MESRVLFRLSIAWLAIVAAFFVLALSDGGHPTIYPFVGLSLPAFVYLIFA